MATRVPNPLPPQLSRNVQRYPRTRIEAFPRHYPGSLQGPYSSTKARLKDRLIDAACWVGAALALLAIYRAPVWWGWLQ